MPISKMSVGIIKIAFKIFQKMVLTIILIEPKNKKNGVGVSAIFSFEVF